MQETQQTWPDVVELLLAYGVDQAKYVPPKAGKNGLSPEQCIALVTQWNAAGKPGGSGALYNKMTNTLAANLDAVVADMQPVESLNARLSKEEEARFEETIQRRKEFADRKAVQSEQIRGYDALMERYGEQMKALEDCEFWALYEEETGRMACSVLKRGHLIAETPVLTRLERMERIQS